LTFPVRTLVAERKSLIAGLEHVLQRIAIERIEFVRREQPGHEIEHDEGRREPERVIGADAVEPARLQRREDRRPTDALPEGGKRRLGAIAASGRKPVGEDGCVHRARAGRGNPLDLDPLLLEQPVEHAPGEGAMGAAALQRQVDRFRRGGRSLFRPDGGVGFARYSRVHNPSLLPNGCDNKIGAAAPFSERARFCQTASREVRDWMGDRSHATALHIHERLRRHRLYSPRRRERIVETSGNKTDAVAV
jgi:hypothetical protein